MLGNDGEEGKPTGFEKSLSFAGKLTTRVVGAVMKGAMKKLFDYITPDRLKILVEDQSLLLPILLELQKKYNTQPDEFTAWGRRGAMIMLKLAGTIQMVGKKVPPAILCNYMNGEFALEYLKDNGEDLYPILNTMNGKRWLINELEEIRIWLFGYDPIVDRSFEAEFKESPSQT